MLYDSLHYNNDTYFVLRMHGEDNVCTDCEGSSEMKASHCSLWVHSIVRSND